METKIESVGDTCHIEIGGPIETNPRFIERLRKVKDEFVVVDIRSTGGSVGTAIEIYEALRSIDAKVTTRCFGYTASAATIIAQAASDGCREISEKGLYLIHASIGTGALKESDFTISAIYAERSGRPVKAFIDLMSENNGNGRWLSPEETVAFGLADTVIEPHTPKTE